MIVLDTNVLSEMLRPRPDPIVVDWLARQAPAQVFTTAISEAEIHYGVSRLEAGKRKDALVEAVAGIFGEDFAGRILAFDSTAAAAYGRIVSDRERSGRPISQFDAQIAAIALSFGADVATRNIRDFEDCGSRLINPWQP